MKGQLFQIKDEYEEIIELIWCSEEFVLEQDVQEYANKYYKNDDISDEMTLEDYLNKELGDSVNDVYFDRVFVTDIVV